MRVSVRWLGSSSLLPEPAPGEAGPTWSVPEGARVADLLALLPLPAGSPLTVLLNGRHAERSQVLREGDELAIFPAVGGGE